MLRTATGRRSRARPRRVLLVVMVLVASITCGSDEPSTEEATVDPSPSSLANEPGSSFGPEMPTNPHLGPQGRAAMHGDSGSSDTTSLPGPGSGAVDVTLIDLGAVCSVVAVGGDGYPVALCTRIADVRPVIHLLDPQDGSALASIEMVAGSLLGGVYGYLDDADRMVLVDGNAELLRVAHRRTGSEWRLEVDERTPLAGAIADGDSVTSVAPDYDGGVWFATAGGTVGLADTGTASVSTLPLEEGERVANSISTAPVGMTVATSHAVYLVGRGRDGRPEVRWRTAYDRGSARKPGQLSWGTGSSPTFFGPTDGTDYVAVVDNAEPEVHLIVIRAGGPDAGTQVCAPVVLGEGGPGSENSPIGAGRTVVVASTYGYLYPRLPEDAGPSRPETAEFVGGMSRVDVRPDDSGCDLMWDSTVRSAAVPKLSTADDTIITMTRTAPAGDGESEGFAYAVIAAETGELLTEQALGPMVGDPLQLAGTTGPDQVLYQGTVGAILRVTPVGGDS